MPESSKMPAVSRALRRPDRSWLGWCAALLFGVSGGAISAFGQVPRWTQQEEIPSPEELRMLSIEELANLEITSAHRRPERLRLTPSAVSVVTDEDIRRAGATSLPEALRLAPGVHVARSNNNTWGIGVRGFNLGTTNKLLVLKDGRNLYSPLFGGVFWDVQDALIEDIDRIEVIRGPGATLWGANAVNGVINIMTKHARDTQGGLLFGGAGTHEDGSGSARYGGQIGDQTWYRVYAKAWQRDDVVDLRGNSTGEERRFALGGFRVDSEPGSDMAWRLHGELFGGRFDRLHPTPLAAVNADGAYIHGRWMNEYEADHHLLLQAKYDHTEREIPGTIDEERDTVVAGFEHRFLPAERHDLLLGADLRISRDNVQPGETIAFAPEKRTVRMFGGYIQDRIALSPDLLDLTLGSKLEHNNYSGFEYQPSARLGWQAAERQFLWSSVSRAVRTPSRLDTDFRTFAFNDEGERELSLRGNPDFRAERLYAYEAGYRAQAAEYPVTVDLAVFYHDYDRIRSVEPDPDGPAERVLANMLEAETYGVELTANVQLSEWWRLRGGYAHLRKRLRAGPRSSDDLDREGPEGNDPEHLLALHSAMDLGEEWAFDIAARHVGALPNPDVPSYTELDARIGWNLREDVELSVMGRNLLESYHREFGATHAVPRTVLFRVRWRL